MSGTSVPYLPQPPAPFTAPVTGSFEQRLAQMAEAINGKVSAGHPPAWTWVGLIDANGVLWKLTVDTSGALHTAQVPR